MDLQLVLYAFAAMTALALARTLGQRQQGLDRARLVQLGLVLVALVAGLLAPPSSGLAVLGVGAALLVLPGPALSVRWALRAGRFGWFADQTVSLFWWGQTGLAFVDIARAQRALQRGDVPTAEVLLAAWAERECPTAARGLFAAVWTASALAGQRWTEVFRRAQRVPPGPATQMAVARAMAELGRPSEALELLVTIVRHPLAPRLGVPLLTAELGAYAVVGDLDAVRQAIERTRSHGAPLPKGIEPYWVGRTLLVKGEFEAAQRQLLMAKSISRSRFPLVSKRIEELLQGGPVAVSAEMSSRYSLGRTAMEKVRRQYIRWFAFMGDGPAPWATRALAAALVLVTVPFVAESAVSGAAVDMNAIAHQLGNHGESVLRGGDYYRLLTALFVHANPMHLAFNVVALLLFGGPVERAWGRIPLLAIFFVSGTLGHLVSATWHVDTYSVGASTGVYGALGAYAVSFLAFRLPGLETFAQRRLSFLAAICVADLALTSFEPTIDTPGHLGGLLIGTAVAWGWFRRTGAIGGADAPRSSAGLLVHRQ